MKFDRVRKEEADTVLKLYRSLLGTPYCVWTEDYPTEKEVEFDFSRDALFCMRDDDGNIIGVISIDDDPNVECLTCWSKTMVPSAEVSRVGISEPGNCPETSRGRDGRTEEPGISGRASPCCKR